MLDELVGQFLLRLIVEGRKKVREDHIEIVKWQQMNG